MRLYLVMLSVSNEMFNMLAVGLVFSFLSVLTSGEVNLALNRPAYQSDYYIYETATSVPITVDGNVSSCTNGAIDWLAVDLGRMYRVKRIVLVTNCSPSNCASSFNVFNVKVFHKLDVDRRTIEFPNCGRYPNSTSVDNKLEVICQENTPLGRYVIIQQPYGVSGGFTVCELEVYGQFGDQYVGCFGSGNWTPNQPLLQSNMSIEVCIQNCTTKKKTYAGLQNGNMCWCADDFNNSLDSTRCNVSCSGDSQQLCGGLDEFSVYSVCFTGLYGTECDKPCQCVYGSACNIVTGTCPNGCDENWKGPTCSIQITLPTTRIRRQYIGCYKDQNDRRDLEIQLILNTPNTIESCMEACGQQGFTYAGPQFSYDCWCGNSYGRYGLAPDAECNYKCSGDSNQKCGGATRYSLYSLCPNGTFGSNCTEICHCLNNDSCSFHNGTCPNGCDGGWTGNSCDTCDPLTPGACSSNETCVDINLAYSVISHCECKNGYKRRNVSSPCIDLDECFDGGYCDPDTTQGCINTIGSYYCTCRDGFRHLDSNTSCSDVDECKTTEYCDEGTEICRNTFGSFKCICKDGFIRANTSVNTSECISSPGATKTLSQTQAGAIVGGVIAGIVILLIIIVIVVLLLVRKRRQKTTQNKKSGFVETNGAMIEGDESPTYSNVNNNSTVVLVTDLPGYVTAHSKLFQKEFESIPTQTKAVCTYGKQKQLKPKNRFKNIIPYDCNRVLLRVPGDPNPFSDYINASYITGFNSEKMIATQGPKQATLADFWTMVHQLRARVIVMLCNLTENGKNKCNRYWPESGSETFGSFQVTLEKEQSWTDFCCRHMTVTKDNSAPLEIVQWQFTSWPDHGVPEHVRTVLSFRRKVRQSMKQEEYTIFHCSAGVGRTGCFFAIDFLLEEARTENHVNVPECVRTMREERPQMIQTLVQYEFVYKALVAHVTLGETAVSSNEFKEVYRNLQQVVAGKSNLEKQFNILKQETTEIKEGGKGRHKSDPIANQSTPLVVSSTKQKDGYRVSKLAEPLVVEEFWKTFPSTCDTVVLLDCNKEFENFLPVNEQSFTLEKLTVLFEEKVAKPFGFCYKLQLMSQNETGRIYENTVVNNIYANVSAGNARGIKVLHVTSSEASIMKYSVLHSIFSEFPDGMLDRGPISIQYRSGWASGSKLAGVLIAARNAVEMIESYGEVDIFQISEELRKIDPNFIPDLQSYTVLHDIVKERLS